LAALDIRILGPLEVVVDGRAVALGGPRRAALLACLATRAGHVVSNDELVDAVWGDAAPAQAAATLRAHVSHLRNTLFLDGRAVLTARSPGYVLLLEQGELDADRFLQAVTDGRRLLDAGRPAEAASRLREGLALWRGPVLADVDAAFARPVVTQLEERRLAALEDRIDADLALGRHAELVGELDALVEEHGLRERLRGQKMLALYRAGRQVEALRCYQDGRDTLGEELGIEPGPELARLEEAILLQKPHLDWEPPEQPAPPVPGRPPLIGRSAELAQVQGALRAARTGRGAVLLVAGDAGIGKTRLLDEAGHVARAAGALVLLGRGHDGDGAPAFWPWIQAVRDYLDEVDDDQAAEDIGAGAGALAPAVPEVGRLAGAGDDLRVLDPEAARFRFFDAVASLLRRASARRPVVVILDDVHWADVPSLLLLDHIAPDIAATRVVVIAGTRESGLPDAEIANALAAIRRQPATARIALRGLPADAVARVIEAATGHVPSPELAAAV
jgi:DNA-binding SARP family transcriptional activator